MANSVAFGIPGVRIDEGDHVCAFYRGLQERDDLLIPYLREGLNVGDKCICVVDATDPEWILASLAGELDVRRCVTEHRIDVLSSADTYLQDGAFDRPAMLAFWDRTIASALGHEAFTFARAVGEMTWALRGVPGVEELVRYEAELNHFLGRYPQVILCLYDLERFGGQVIVDILKTHPKILLGGTVLENPYYLAPAEFLATRS